MTSTNEMSHTEIDIYRSGDLDKVKKLINSGSDVHLRTDYPLRLVCGRGHYNIVKYLLDIGAAGGPGMRTLAFAVACYNNHLDIAQLLLDNGSDLHSGNDCALRDACFNGNLEVVKFLVENGADIHAGNNYAFIWACYIGHLGIVKYLVSKGADVHAEDDAAFTWAEKYGHTEVLTYLKSLGPPKPKSRFPKKPTHITFRDNDKCPITHDSFTADTPTVGCSKCRNKFIKEALEKWIDVRGRVCPFRCKDPKFYES
jgi:ankyrin repeat protein